jgi:hypothetical protein
VPNPLYVNSDEQDQGEDEDKDQDVDEDEEGSEGASGSQYPRNESREDVPTTEQIEHQQAVS